MISGDWYTWMDEWETKHDTRNHFLVDCVGGLIRLHRARESDIVATFTAEQAKCFFFGLCKYYNTAGNPYHVESQLAFKKSYLDDNDIPYEPKDNHMSLREEYCYLCAVAYDNYDFDERF